MPFLFSNVSLDSSTFGDDDWTSALPNCPWSRIATSTNQIYQSNGFKKDDHPFYETAFNFLQNDVTFYGLFSGKNSARCSKFAASAFPAELLLDNHISSNNSGEQVQQYLKDAWCSVDKQFMNSLDDLIMDRLRMEAASEDLGEQYQQYADKTRQTHLDNEIKATASGILAVVLREQVILSYMGDCVGILVHAEDNFNEPDQWKVSVLTCGHNVENEDEKIRLGEQAMVDLEIMETSLTRFLGQPSLKKVHSELLEADELILNISENWKFIVLASPGVFEALSDLNPGLEDVSKLADILVRFISDQFIRVRETEIVDKLNRVTQNVVDEIGRHHFQAYSESQDFAPKRPDMTLLIRIFDESLITPSGQNATLTNHSMVSSVASLNLSSEQSLRRSDDHPYAPTKRIPVYVDFSKFIQNASADPNFPRELLDTRTPTEDPVIQEEVIEGVEHTD